MLAINLVLFGPLGMTIWAVQMMWIPIWAAGVINGIGHYWGYRNFASADTSTNLVPWGILVGGEELHNNHHAYGSSAQALVALVGVRPGLDVHPHPRIAAARDGAQGRAEAAARRTRSPCPTSAR